MANNRLYLCAVDADGNVKKELFVAKHFGGAWHHCWYQDDYPFDYALNLFFDDAFINQWGLALIAEDMDYPTNAVWNYND